MINWWTLDLEMIIFDDGVIDDDLEAVEIITGMLIDIDMFTSLGVA